MNAYERNYPFRCPTKMDITLIGRKLMARFMRYVHTERKPMRSAAERAANPWLAMSRTSCFMEMSA